MPCDAGTEDISVGGVVRHREVVDIRMHKEMVDMLVMCEETQSDRSHIEAGIDVHPRVVPDLGGGLGGEHTGSRTEDGCMVTSEIAQVDTDLCVQRFEPRAVIVEPMLQDNPRYGDDAVACAVLDNGPVFEIDPGGGDVETDVAREDLHVPVVLGRFPIGSRDVDGIGLVLKAEVDGGFDPGGGISDTGTTEETVGEAEVVLPLEVVGFEMLQVPVRRFTLGICTSGDEQRIFAGPEACFHFSVHIKLTYLVTEHADGSFDGVMDVGTAVLMDGPTDEGVVGPFIIVYTVVRHGVTHEPLAFVHGKSRDTEFEFGVIRFAEGDSDGVADGEHVGGVSGLAVVVVGGIIETLVGGFFDIAPVGVVRFKDMTESHEGDVPDLEGVLLDPSSVFDNLDGVVVRFLGGDSVLVMEVTAEVAVPGHGVESDGDIFRCQTTAELGHILQSSVIEMTHLTPPEGSVHAVVGAGVTSPYGAAVEFTGSVLVVPHRTEIIHLDTEVQAPVDVSGEQKINIVLLVSCDESFLVRDSRVRGSGVKEPLLLRRDDVGRQTPCEGVVDGLKPMVDDATLDGGDEYVSVGSATEGVGLLHIHVVVVEHRRVLEGDGVGYSGVTRHLPCMDDGLGTRPLGSGHKGRCQQH